MGVLREMNQHAPIDTLSESEFHRRAEAFLTTLGDALDAADIDWEQAPGGVMQIDFDDGSQIVINKQPPLREIWVAARAGGFHFRYSGGSWIDTRSGDELAAALDRHVSAQCRRPVRLALTLS